MNVSCFGSRCRCQHARYPDDPRRCTQFIVPAPWQQHSRSHFNMADDGCQCGTDTQRWVNMYM